MSRSSVVKDYLEKFKDVPSLALAKMIVRANRDLFDNDVEKARTIIRYYRGANGSKNRVGIDNRYSFKTPKFMPKTWREIRTPYILPTGLWLIAACIHIPYHEPDPIESMVCYAQKHKIDGILFNGDLQDCQAVSRWASDDRDIDSEIYKTVQFLEFIQYEFPKARKVWKPGNHEYRLPRYYMDQAKAIAGSSIGAAAMETVLDLEGRGIEFLDYFQPVMAGKLPIFHGHEFKLSTVVNPARGLFNKIHTWGLCAHHHRSSMQPNRNFFGDLLTTWSIGCLCGLSPDYLPYNDWNWGFALVNVEKNGQFEVENRRILPNGKVV